MNKQLLWLRRMRDLCQLLASERRLAVLFPRILDAAIELTEAERGFLVMVEDKREDGSFRFRVKVARGFGHRGLQSGAGKVSRTVVRRVLDEDRSLVSLEEDRDVMDVTSVQASSVRSIACVPMRLRGEVRGVLYLDHSSQSGRFSQEDLPILESFADQAALALETAALDQGEDASAEAGWVEAPRRARGETGELIGGSASMRSIGELIERYARSWQPVLITGESGTGKELAARELHARGSFPNQPFVSESCGALADTLLEAELFGYERGAFTGAAEAREGLFVRAQRGTLLLDEVADMSLGMQAKLLRVLQERQVRPLGSHKAIPVRCRFLATTREDLRELVAAGNFREDLYYRLDVLRLSMPPLRERPEDLPELVTALSARARLSIELSEPALRRLAAWSFPGNVRELSNELLRLASLQIPKIGLNHLSERIRHGSGVSGAESDFGGKTLEEVQKEMVKAALGATSGNKSLAARQLGITRTKLYRLIKDFELG